MAGNGQSLDKNLAFLEERNGIWEIGWPFVVHIEMNKNIKYDSLTNMDCSYTSKIIQIIVQKLFKSN